MGIKFGTDGWRAVIAKEFTFANLALVNSAVGKYLKKELPGDRKLAVGYDRRFLSKEFAESTAVYFANQGYEIAMCDTYFPTPAISWAAKFMPGMAGGVVITASHNPPTYNGFKFKEKFGGSAFASTTKAFENIIAESSTPELKEYDPALFPRFVQNGSIKMISLTKPYTEALLSQVDVHAIAKAKFKVGIDTMHGSASNHFYEFLTKLGVEVEALHQDENPAFDGHAPEPTEENIMGLQKLVAQKKLHCGFANDGDADRLAAVDEHGRFFSTQKILSLVYYHMIKNRKKRWNICRSASTTRLVDLIAEKYGLQCIETPVGFKYIAENIVAGNAQIGGEESGGIGIVDHIPERDGFLTAILLLEMQAMSGKGLAALYDDLCKELRPYQFVRLDLHVAPDVMSRAMSRLKSESPKLWMGRKVKTLSTLDGYKFYLEDGSWLLIRPSGTEPLFRLYGETESSEASDQLVQVAKAYVEQMV